ncbi:MAG: cytochrome c3 family protein [Bacteroidota bacterium]
MTKDEKLNAPSCRRHSGMVRRGHQARTPHFFRITPYLLGLILLFSTIPVFGAGEEPTPAQTGEGLLRGERLFYGLIDGKFSGPACADCHNTVEIDTFNWNPNAWEIAHKYKNQDLAVFKKAVMSPTGKVMSEVHKTFTLEEPDIEMIKIFLDRFEEKGLKKQKPVINKIFLFLLLGALLTWSIIDLVFLKKVKKRYLHFIILAGALGWQAKLLYEAGSDLGRQQGYEPDQPVKFSHRVHATDNHIDCKYCHYTSEYSKSAGIPEVNLCMNCHILVREGSHSGKYEISKVVNAFEAGKSIEWIRVHNLPDHAFFSHAQHVQAGKLQCQVCHGEVENMDRVKQVSSLAMGWCINCHRDTEVQFFDNAFYEQYKDLHEAVKNGTIDRVTAMQTGGTECSKCHY